MRPRIKGDYWSWSYGWVKFKKRQYNKKLRKFFKELTKEIMEDMQNEKQK
jgi:hypothetical protein